MAESHVGARSPSHITCLMGICIYYKCIILTLVNTFVVGVYGHVHIHYICNFVIYILSVLPWLQLPQVKDPGSKVFD